MKNFIKEIKERKVRKWLAIYLSTAITTIGVTHLLSLRYNLPNYIFDIVFFTILFGIPGTAISAWFHGKEGRQKIKMLEIVLQSVLFIGLLSTLYLKIDFKGKKKLDSNKRIIAVLPFENFNNTQETEFFADGITDDVLTQLSKISDLKVISRTSVMKYKNSDMNIQQISEELGAGTILEGSVRTYGNKIRITGQLIDANNDIHIWSETFDRELENIFDIQTDIAERIAAALQTQLTPLEKQQIEIRPTDNLDAYTYYLKGKHHYYNYTENENEKAIEFFEKALQVDPNYALAIAGLSEAYAQRVSKYWKSSEWIDSALILSRKALEINPNLAEGYKSLGSCYQSKEEYELAITNYQRAIELNPNYWSAMLNFGQLKTFLGNHDEALYWLRRANELTPNDILGNVSVGLVYKNLNCDSAAISWVKKAVSLDPNNKFSNFYLGEMYLWAGDMFNAEKYFRRTIEIDSNWVFGWFLGTKLETAMGNNLKAKEYGDRYMDISDTAPEWFYAYNLIQLEKVDSAIKILNEELDEYEEYLKEASNTQVFNYMALSEIHSLLNNKDQAFEWWRKAVDKGYTEISRIENYPYLENIRSDQRYDDLLRYMSEKIDSFKNEAASRYPEYFDCR
jgi:TolB-like protein/Tfp pilus assembly protein PilF